MQGQTQISAIIGLLVVAALIVFRKRLGVLNAASWLVIWGSVVLLGEHPQFSLTYAAGVVWPEAKQLVLIPHARTHFFMAGIYAIIGLVLLDVIARTLLREGRRAGWYALLFALVAGGGIDLVVGGLWYQHGSPLYFMKSPIGFGWQFLYVYLVAWAAALTISYKPIFAKAPDTEMAA
jgi:hypothetical protein